MYGIAGEGFVAGSDVFGDLRALRSSPPGWANTDKARRAVFAAAMEQSEQLLRTADALGYATRALNLFYGLSQAGRAVMAAWCPPSAGRHNGWQLSGHGIGWGNSVSGLEQRTLRGELPKHTSAQQPTTCPTCGHRQSSDSTADEQSTPAKFVDKPQSSFVGLSRLLGSDPMKAPVKLVDVWAALPEAIARPAPGDDKRLGPVEIQMPTFGPGQANWIVGAVQAWTHNWPLKPVGDWSRDGDGGQFNNRLHAFVLAHYPTIPPPMTTTMTEPWPIEYLGRRVSIALTFGLSSNMEQREGYWLLEAQQTPYRGQHWAFPAFAGRELHPLMMWWTVLYGLSMLTRYEPRAWAQLLDVDSSTYSTPLEHLLDEAMTAVPQVVAETLRLRPGRYVDDEQPPT